MIVLPASNLQLDINEVLRSKQGIRDFKSKDTPKGVRLTLLRFSFPGAPSIGPKFVFQSTHNDVRENKILISASPGRQTAASVFDQYP